jgi:hypothetical protein
MFTISRVFFALNMMLTGALTLAGNEVLPMWARFMTGLAALFTGGMLAFNGPVQNTTAQNVIAKAAVADAKAAVE